MVWGAICHNGRTELITVRGTLTSDRYCQEVIVPFVVPFIQGRNGMIFQQDNARAHSARNTQAVLAEHNVQTLHWPAKSPDLSPIEHMWDILGRRVRERNDVHNVRDLERVLHEEWRNVPVANVNKLIASMRRRCVAVIDRDGLHTRY